MPKRLVPLAIAYDFDGTLAPGNMQEHSFIPNLGIKKEDFWKKVKQNAKTQDMDEILSYMYLMLREADGHDQQITRGSFADHGRGLPLYDGVADWFSRINQYGKNNGVRVHHYVISSGLREMLDGTDIAKEFDFIFASGFMYDQHDVAKWPALAVNYTNKTQYLFRINKGIINSWDNEKINKFFAEQERPVPFSNMIYIGDGETDIPSMKMIRYQGGYAVAVYNAKKRKTANRPSPKEICLALIEQKRADFALPADYRDGKELDILVKAVIDKVRTQKIIQELGERG
jgi:hypothetical protein